jgi:actin-like ATPase involved in cell morphogenesis
MKHQATDSRTLIGLDIGTSRIVAARQEDGEQIFDTQLNAFVSIPFTKLTQASLEKEGIPHSVTDGQIVVFGNESAKLADLLGREIRRPMTRGVLNPNEAESLPQIEKMIETLIGRADANPAKVCFSVPAPAAGSDDNLTYHEATVRQVLSKLGYHDAAAVNEGLAVIYSELEDSNYTGVGISFGGGLCNVALAYMSVPVLTFSVPKAGDFIDSSAASVTGELTNRIRITKEETFHFNGHFSDKTMQAINVYYDDMIHTVVNALREALQNTKTLPRLGRAVPLVLSGGGVMPKGFRERFEEALKAAALPLPITEVRIAKDPLQTTARGALIAAITE